MRWGALVLLAGCDAALGLRAAIVADASAIDGMPHPSCGDPPSNADEDGDGIANAIDDCPSTYDKAQHDTDGDGVGDPCDPHPTTPGDHFVDTAYFDADLGCWIPDTIANWTLANGSVTTPVMSTQTVLSLDTVSLSTVTSKPTLEIRFTFVQENPAKVSANVPIIIELDLAYATSTSRCGVVTYPDGASQLQIDSSAAGPGLPNTYGASHQLTFYRDGVSKTCTIDRTTSQTLPDNGMPDVMPKLAIRVSNGSARIDYAIVYGSD